MPIASESRVVAAVAGEPTVTLGWDEDLGDGWDNEPTWDERTWDQDTDVGWDQDWPDEC